MKFEKTEVFNIKGALRGMRNPLQSHHKSDSFDVDNHKYLVGTNDIELGQKLIRAGSEHRKFLRQIFVCVDITAPLYIFKEFDTYKVGTVANSTSTMHKLATTPITGDCFETDDYNDLEFDFTYYDGYTNNQRPKYTASLSCEMSIFIDLLETLRQKYLETKDKRYWKELIRWLPESWLQTRTITMNYENVYSMIRQRRNHKLTEWSKSFINWAKTLPYAKEWLFLDLDINKPSVFEVDGSKEAYDEANEVRLTKDFLDDCLEVSEKLRRPADDEE